MTLNDYLKQRNLTHEEFAELLGCDRTTVTKWLDGSRVPSARWAQLIEVRTEGKVKAKDLRSIDSCGGGQRLYGVIVTRGLTIQQAAHLMSMSRNALSAYIKDQSKPSRIHVAKIKHYFGVSL
jgi:transcriptional regulator with XRE-family HTH domain